MANLTPMMQQYLEIKNKHQDSILFFRLGDFYEMFFEDALLASKELEIALTGRDCGQEERAPMCGVPYHSADGYIAKLVEKGYKVAICEQVENPAEAKGIVKRDVVRIITPGTIIDSSVLDEKSNNYLCCIFRNDSGLGISYVDVSTGDMYTTEMTVVNSFNTLLDELSKIQPTEIIINKSPLNDEKIVKELENKYSAKVTIYNEWAFDYEYASKKIMKQLSTLSLDGFGLKDKNHAISSAGALIEYINETQKVFLSHLNHIAYYSIDKFMILDVNSRKNLELTETIRGKSKKGSLLWLLDKTSTAMGGRLLKRWIEEPLIEIDEVRKRLDAVDYLVNNIYIMDEIKNLLNDVYDLERLLSKIVYGNCNGRDLISLKQSVKMLPHFKKILSSIEVSTLQSLGNSLDTLSDVYELIEDAIIDDPPPTIKDGGIIKSEYSVDLLKLREASAKGREWLLQLQEGEKSKTGIRNLKIGYNKVFGYYIEVTRSNLDLVPDYYIRKQTLANSERYITPELEEIESKILGAEERSIKLEYEMFVLVRDKIKEQAKRIQHTAKVVASVDVLNSFAQVAYKNNYCRPNINNEGIISINNGRHPVVEKMISGEFFVPNDTKLDNNNNRIAIITGPNMAGKSTYMRQVALITLMSHIGSFVPASKANIPIVDRIFTRVGASDDLSQGQSTFMVEMTEVANILNNATSNSLVILDEIGRGTSTYDGLSIAWAVIEYISSLNKIGAKTLFATHYHELTDLENRIDGLKNYNILVKEKGEDIIFLRKIEKGMADKSYGIEVARLAGVPDEVILRAKDILSKLEERDINKNNVAITRDSEKPIASLKIKQEKQLNLFNIKESELINKIKEINVVNMTPLDAINILYEITEEAKKI